MVVALQICDILFVVGVVVSGSDLDRDFGYILDHGSGLGTGFGSGLGSDSRNGVGGRDGRILFDQLVREPRVIRNS